MKFCEVLEMKRNKDLSTYIRGTCKWFGGNSSLSFLYPFLLPIKLGEINLLRFGSKRKKEVRGSRITVNPDIMADAMQEFRMHLYCS